MKTFKEKSPRFKHFSTYEEAVRFSHDGGGDESSFNAGDHGNSNDERPTTPCPPPTADEVPRPFPAPTRPQLTVLKKAIETKDIGKVLELVHENPRYLINCNGDTPTILQEGFRYNALHVAARVGHVETMKGVVELFQDETSAYVHRLYPDDRDGDTTAIRRRLLLDYYLNTPDKGCNDTPLHFAVKNGFVDAVKYLCSIEECQRTLVNKNGLTPKDLAVESDRIPEKAKKEILRVLDDGPADHYVPLYRARDEADAPILHRPTAGFPEIALESNGKDLVDYRLAAYIGPVTADVADQVYVHWAFTNDGSPPGRTPKKPSGKSESKAVMNAAAAVKRSDLHKGMERIGRQIATAGNYGWSEYWNFLRVFVDLRTETGLKQMELYFSQKNGKNDQTKFEKDLKSRFEKIVEESHDKDSCRRKLDFTNVGEDDEKDRDASRDSTDLYFDATEAEEAGGDDQKGKKQNKEERSPLNFEQLWDREESRDGFFTPPQELTANVIVGQEPTKLDLDVFATLENVVVDESKYPRTAAWLRMIREFSDDERRRWLPLDSPRSATAGRLRKLLIRASD